MEKAIPKEISSIFINFYGCFPDIEIGELMRSQSDLDAIFQQSLRVSDEDARVWYMSEAAHENWNVKMLDRNISTQ